MNFLLRIAYVVFMVSTASAASAAEEDAFLKDYTGIVKLLRADGIEPSSVKWAEVEAMCLPFLDNASPIPYNRCRLDKARSQIVYQEDATICQNESRAFKPKTLRYRTYIETEDGVATPISIPRLESVPAVADETAFHQYLFDRCMTEKSWNNPNNYRRGQAN